MERKQSRNKSGERGHRAYVWLAIINNGNAILMSLVYCIRDSAAGLSDNSRKLYVKTAVGLGMQPGW